MHTTSISLHHLIQRSSDQSQALRTVEGCPIPFSNLQEQIDYVGNVLRISGVARNDTVAVVLPNGPSMASTFLGVATHAICAPLNPQYGKKELAFYLSDLNAKAAIIPAGLDSPVREVCRNKGIRTFELEMDSVGSGLDRFTGFDSADTGCPAKNGGHDVAMVLHTSGTTSRPKQVPLTHQNLCASATAIGKQLALTSEDVCLNVMPLFHIHGLVGVLLASLGSGGSVICTPGFHADSVTTWLRELNPTWYSAVPTMHQATLASLKHSNQSLEHRLRLIRSSSAALPPALMSEMESTFGVPVIESYGMTEASHQMASNPLPPASRKSGSVGMPAGPEMAIMDEKGCLLEHDQQGEIVIRGASVTSGYCNHPEANAEAFTDGWFRTGDLGYRDEDGYYFISGRKKEMINRGGESVSPREIDEALLTHGSVQQAVAFAIQHPTLGEDICCAIVLKPGAIVTETELRQFAIEQLAQFKVPSRFLIVESIPKGPTGKLQRIGLQEVLANALQVDYVAPGNELESLVISCFETILEVKRIGVDDNFFASGGDSIKSTRVLARLTSELKIDFPATAIFQRPTARELSTEIERQLTEQTKRLETLLGDIETMSDQEVRRILGSD